MFGTVRDALSLASSVQKSYEYWKEYKGERIVIRYSNIERDEEHYGKMNRTDFVIEGEVEDVKTRPAGFMLKDVEERTVMDENSMEYNIDDSTSPEVKIPGNRGEMTIRKIDRKFVSFDAIEELEFKEDVESEEHPIRDNHPNTE